MTSEATAIKIAFEQEKMTPEEIAIDRDLELTAVKAALMQVSSVYRAACKTETKEEEDPTLNFGDDELRQVNRVIMEIALDGDNDASVRLKAATYVRDDKKGRKEVVKSVQNLGNTFNILGFNTQLVQARDMVDKMKRAMITDVSPNKE